MKGYPILLSIFLFIGLFGSIRFLDDNDYAKDVLTLHANINNRESNSDVDNARLKYVFLDNVDVRASSRTSDIQSGDMGIKVISTYLDDYQISPGEYWVKIYVYGDDGQRDIKHRVVVIE